MKLLKKILAAGAALCFALSAAPTAWADMPSDPRFDNKSWEQVVEQFMTDHDVITENVSMGYLNTVTGEEHYFNGDEYMVTGSMYKVPLNMYYTEQISLGKMDWDADIYGYQYSTMLRMTIIDSNNEVAAILWEKMGNYNIYRQLIAPYMGVDPNNADPKYYQNNYFTAEQMIYCLSELYTQPERFPKVLDTMLEAEPEKYFKRDERRFDIAHKYGFIEDEGGLWLNDCGVCYTEEPIIIVIFTHGIHDPNTVLADFCTLMCDYSQYYNKVRLEQEKLDAAQQKKKQEEEQALQQLLQEQPEGKPVEGLLEDVSFPEDAASSEPAFDFEPVLLGLAVAAAALGIALVAVLSKKYRMKPLPLCLAVAAVVIALGLCAAAPKGGTFLALPNGDPRQTLSSFMDDLISGDYDNAYAALGNFSDLGLQNKPDSDTSDLVYAALRHSYAYKLVDEPVLQGTQASQKLALQYLDIASMQEDLNAEVTKVLEEMVAELPKNEVYDKNKNYLPNVTEAAYEQAVKNLLLHASDYYASIGCTVTLKYTGGEWKIIADSALLKALSGGAY